MATKTYKFKDIDMLMAAKTLAENFITHKTAIISSRPLWKDPFITNFQARVDAAIEKFGIDKRKDQKLLTQDINTKHGEATSFLSTFKVQVEADYKKDKIRLKWLLDTLGYTRHWKQAQKGDQETLIQLLYTFKANVTTALKTELTAKGMNVKMIDAIIALAPTLKTSNTNQETQKGKSIVMTAELRAELNSIYADAISIGTINYNMFRTTPAVRDKFSFSRLVAVQNQGTADGEADEVPVKS